MSKDDAEASSRKGAAKRARRAAAAPTGKRNRKSKAAPALTSDHELRRQLTALRDFS